MVVDGGLEALLEFRDCDVDQRDSPVEVMDRGGVVLGKRKPEPLGMRKPERRARGVGRLRNAGWRGSFLGEKPSSIVDSAIRTSWRWTVAHHFYPHSTNSDVSLRKNDNKDFNRVAGKFGVG